MVKSPPQLTLNEKYQRIWSTAQLIPQGKVACYGQIADLAGLPGRARLVGKALANADKNSWRGREVPWFRIINAQGKISFAVGSDHFKQQKEALLSEGVTVSGNKVKLKDHQWQPDLSEILHSLEF